MTSTGVFFILTSILGSLKYKYLVFLLLLSSIFQVAAVVNIGTRGIPEIINERETGLIFSIEENNFLEKLNEFLSIDFDRNKIKKFSKQFSLENITKQYISLYNEFR